MNKGAQIFLSRASPILYIGIFIFALPFMGPVIKMNIPSWLTYVGLTFIVIGSAVTIFDWSDNDRTEQMYR